jgi:hypothetical protein
MNTGHATTVFDLALLDLNGDNAQMVTTITTLLDAADNRDQLALELITSAIGLYTNLLLKATPTHADAINYVDHLDHLSHYENEIGENK